MEMTTAFTDVLHVANLTTGAHLMSILSQADAFTKVTQQSALSNDLTCDNPVQKLLKKKK